DDCDGTVDEDFKQGGAWLLDEHCGTCNNGCADKIDHGVGACGGTAAAPVCIAASCDEGYVKINEFQCQLPPDVSCQLCAEDADCYAGTCEPLDGQAVCLAPCDLDGGCPEGHVCEVGDAGVERCMPTTGSCSCTAGNDGAKRTCEDANLYGACFGVETCDGETGWGGCSAPMPALEECDGYDQDCDGLIDEDVPVGFACENTVAGIGACPGVAACFGSQGTKCQGPVPTQESCDYQDNDCDGAVDEDYLDDDLYADFDHCGACNTSCAVGFPNAAGTTCQSDGAQAQCVVTACEEGFVQINDFQCIPDVANICQECATDANCLGADAACVALAEGSFCGKGCGVASDCPEGFSCDDVGKPSKQCVPSTGSCSCDGTNSSLSVACDKTHTPGDPSQPAYTCTGSKQCTSGGWGECDLPAEACDGIDNDCDGLTDDPFQNANGQYHLVAHCGGCGISCLAVQPPHAVASCDLDGLTPQCGYACESGWFDVNGLSDDGCECAPVPGDDLVGDGADTNCDGIEGEIAKSLFVTKTGDDDATGDWQDPMRTLDAAIARAETVGARDVLVATGVYSENVALRSGIGVY
ncbi:MAG: MopE-related protein, partial [Myxococcota bacterium]|nr:MopE-related protein [Myxococcota bacterium]